LWLDFIWLRTEFFLLQLSLTFKFIGMSVFTKTVSVFRLFKQALKGEEQSYTSGSIDRAIFLLSVPMIMEMAMESLFAIVDAFYVSRLGVEALATVSLTESVLTLVYSLAIGLSMGATAMVARRVGEQNISEAAKAGDASHLPGDRDIADHQYDRTVFFREHPWTDGCI
jgi:Na+-driven multidrug efflux pump